MIDPSRLIPFHRPSIGIEEQEEVARVLASGWLTSGPRAAQLEEEFRLFVNARYAAAVSSATAGLHVAMEGLGIGHGDEVITTPLTFCSTVHSIIHTGAKPVLADVGPDGNIDPDSVAARITTRTVAIVPVHLGGLPCNLAKLWTLARAHDLLVIEDAAHAAGSGYEGRYIGASGSEGNNHSDAVVFSMYATKNITSAEGGIVTTWRQDLLGRIRRLSLHGIDNDIWNRQKRKQSWKYDVVETGWKYNLSDLQAAVGLAQLRKLPGFLHARRQLAKFYNERLSHLEEIELPSNAGDGEHSWHLYSLRLHLDKLRIDRDTFIEELQKRGVAASVHFIPIPLHSAFAQQSAEWQRSCPAAITLYHRILSIPLYPALTSEQSQHIVQAVEDVAVQFRHLQFTGYTGNTTEFILQRARLIDPSAELRYEAAFREYFKNRRVFITGAAGFIGRKLCSRLLALRPSFVLGIDRSENGIFQFDAELRQDFLPESFELRIGDVCNQPLMTDVMNRFRIDTVIHAAAYKHVPLMEQHPIEAIRNNVLGMWSMAGAVAGNNIRNLLLISTDKAAKPLGIMGKTKRASEQIVTALAKEKAVVDGGSIRLGNVLGSEGSVSHTILRQIEEGQPVTITHPDVSRYFITPEETAHYIFRALLLRSDGGIFVPEMGTPIPILQLAQRLAQSRGRQLNAESEINVIGLRPGEKLSEDLKSDEVEFLPTKDDAIRIVREPAPGWSELAQLIARLAQKTNMQDITGSIKILDELT